MYQEDVKNYLLKLGFKKSNLGLEYLSYVIMLGVQGCNLQPMKKCGYKLIADRYGKSEETIEKDIQNCISNAWLFGNADLLYDLFGATVSLEKGKPTNKHFIFTIVENFKINNI